MLHKFGKVAYLLLGGVLLVSFSGVCAAQGTEPVSTTSEVKQAPATVETAAAPAPQPAPTPAPAQTPVPAAAPSASGTVPVAVEAGTVPVAVTAAKSALSAKDFLLTQEEMSYGVVLTQKASKPNYPYKENPVIYDEKNERLTVVTRLFPEENLKGLNNALNAVAITIMTYKKDDKEQDCGLVALEFNEASKAEFENYKTLIKASILTFFKEDNFIMADKFPMIVIAAHNHPDKKKDDIKWVGDLIQKKFSK